MTTTTTTTTNGGAAASDRAVAQQGDGAARRLVRRRERVAFFAFRLGLLFGRALKEFIYCFFFFFFFFVPIIQTYADATFWNRNVKKPWFNFVDEYY
jgi:hypothetical protein